MVDAPFRDKIVLEFFSKDSIVKVVRSSPGPEISRGEGFGDYSSNTLLQAPLHTSLIQNDIGRTRQNRASKFKTFDFSSQIRLTHSLSSFDPRSQDLENIGG